MWGAQLVKGDQPKDYLKTTDRLDIPRIDYTNGEPSILLEPSRTNLVSNSNNPYSLEQVTQTSVLSPEGINNAFRLTETTANAQHFAQILSSVTSGVVHTISFFIKKEADIQQRNYTHNQLKLIVMLQLILKLNL